MNTRQLALLSVLTALCVGLQLALRPVQINVEFTSLISFIVGVAFGSWIGATLGAFVMFVNGFLSPYGFAGPVILPFQMVGMFLIGFVCGLYSKAFGGITSKRAPVKVAVLGALLTLIYDIMTNLGFSLFANSIAAFISVLVMGGALFSFIHVISNAFLFMASIPILNAIRELVRR